MSDLTVTTLAESDSSLWNQFVTSSPQGTPFSTTQWAEVIRSLFNVGITIFAVKDKEQLVAGISLFHKKKSSLNYIARIPLSPYTGVLFFPPTDEKHQKLLSEYGEILSALIPVLSRNFHFGQLSLHPSLSDVRQFQWQQWHVVPQFTFINQIENTEKLWEGLSSSVRRKINRAEEKQFVVAEKDNPTVLMKLQEESYLRNGLRPLLPRDVFERYAQELLARKLLRIYSIADAQGNIHAERAVVLWKQQVYDWIAGTDTRFMEHNATHLLVWEILTRLSAEGYTTFDFLGANTPHIVDFKQSFGGKLTTYYDVSFYRSRWIKMLDNVRKRFILLRRKS
jgi:lipid II:glycine glycyltransferase (peptidoglycan interpeptide bridge formation enzyme)